MTAKKQKEKDRRRARKLADQAWQAANDQNLDLAEKLIRRAVATQPENPVLWNDQGVLLTLRHEEAEAEASFCTALSLAPTFAEVYTHLAALRVRRGLLAEAVGLQSQAVKHAPPAQAAAYAERLATYQTLAGRPTLSGTTPSHMDEGRTAPAGGEHGGWPVRLVALDWQEFDDRLTRDGCLVIPGLVHAGTCADLRAMFEEDALFAKTVVMDREDFGRGVYRYFRAPIPQVVDELRRAAYVPVARVANAWQRLLGEPARYPDEWDEFRTACRDAGQTTPTPILLKYGPGGYNALHRDLRGQVFFPIQMAVVLSPRADPTDPASEGFRGGDFLLCDVPEREKSRRRSVPAGLGDTLLFCTRDRLVRVGGAYGLQPVKHGVEAITAGTRFVLGVPFHEYR